MVTVRIDQQNTLTDIGQIRTMPDLVEFVKATIDPDKIITKLSIGGHVLSDSDWQVPLSVQGETVLDVTTGRKEEYVAERLHSAIECLGQIILEFDEASTAFGEGKTVNGNTVLHGAVEDLSAFVTWYDSILAMLPAVSNDKRGPFLKQVEIISLTCQQLVEQQLYNSWWAIAETVKTRLGPQLRTLQTVCRETKTSISC